MKSNFEIDDKLKPCLVLEKIYKFKMVEFPNMCLLSKVVMSQSASNSTVERAFSILTLLLSERRLHMKHSTMEEILMINLNNKNWSTVV